MQGAGRDEAEDVEADDGRDPMGSADMAMAADMVGLFSFAPFLLSAGCLGLAGLFPGPFTGVGPSRMEEGGGELQFSPLRVSLSLSTGAAGQPLCETGPQRWKIRPSSSP